MIIPVKGSIETVSEAFSMGTSANSEYVFIFYPRPQIYNYIKRPGRNMNNEARVAYAMVDQDTAQRAFPATEKFMGNKKGCIYSRYQACNTSSLKLKGYGTVPEFLPGSIAEWTLWNTSE